MVTIISLIFQFRRFIMVRIVWTAPISQPGKAKEVSEQSLSVQDLNSSIMKHRVKNGEIIAIPNLKGTLRRGADRNG